MKIAKQCLNSVVLFLLFNSPVCLAINDIASFSSSLFEGSGILIIIFSMVSVFVGFILLASAFSAYREHRNNPKFIPLDRPIIFLILGLSLVLFPFVGRILKISYSPLDEAHEVRKRLKQNVSDLDAPLN
ncbi:MAG: hypothetical protein JWM09_681 [Francisellaceae bacterium]|nr:hypothetical protein [Francisellaceae bacterium]